MVVDVQNMMTRNNKPWGRFKLEDYNGAHEFVLFGKDYENFRQFLQGLLPLRARQGPAPHPLGQGDGPPRCDRRAGVQDHGHDTAGRDDGEHQEPDSAGSAGEINPAFIDGLTRTLKKSKGKASLHLNVYDPQSNVKVAFLSKGYKVEVSADLLTYFDDLNMPYTIS